MSSRCTSGTLKAGKKQPDTRGWFVPKGIDAGEIDGNPLLIGSDANMCPEYFKKSMWFQGRQMFVVVPKEASTCRSKGPKGEWIERTYDYVIACNSFKGKNPHMKVVKDFESRPHKAVSFVVERDKEVQEWNERFLPAVEEGCQGEALKKQVEKEESGGRRIGN